MRSCPQYFKIGNIEVLLILGNKIWFFMVLGVVSETSSTIYKLVSYMWLMYIVSPKLPFKWFHLCRWSLLFYVVSFKVNLKNKLKKKNCLKFQSRPLSINDFPSIVSGNTNYSFAHIALDVLAMLQNDFFCKQNWIVFICFEPKQNLLNFQLWFSGYICFCCCFQSWV